MRRAGRTTRAASPARLEAVAVGVLTLLGAGLRLWAPGRLGLVHFDEGIYASAGVWPFLPGGLWNYNPAFIAYAPPGFPIEIGLVYLMLGIGDISAILVSIAVGTLTIPLIGWFARRTYGPGAGAVASALAAFSGFHVAFSRMAMTDVSFLFAWMLALLLGQRFLERPNAVRALALGLAVGLSQLFKYNGWLSGAVVVLGALSAFALDPAERKAGRWKAVWGYGSLSAAIAILAYLPWLRFVERNGGYSALLRHQRGYLGGFEAWGTNLGIQLDQVSALSGGIAWNGMAWFAACLCFVLIRRSVPENDRGPIRPLASFCLLPFFAAAPRLVWLSGVPASVMDSTSRSQARRLAVLAWLVLSVMTPLYHPYARLWLPLQAIGWVMVGGFVIEVFGSNFRGSPRPGGAASLRTRIAGISVALGLAGAAFHAAGSFQKSGGSRPLPGILAPTDSLKRAVGQIREKLESEGGSVRLLVRPPVRFYLGGRGDFRLEPDLDSLLGPEARGLALVDMALLRQGSSIDDSTRRLLERWEKIAEYPTELNLPTLLDMDPGAAKALSSELSLEPLWLLRPRKGGPG